MTVSDFPALPPNSQDTRGPLARDGVALWHQIETRLAEDLEAGVYRPGEKLPGEHRLAKRFGVNRHTVRRAVGQLASRGLVRVEQGRGIFAQDLVVDYAVTRRTSFSGNLLAQGLEPTTTLLEVESVAADERVASMLRMDPGANVIRSRSVGYADNVPICCSTSFFPVISGLMESLSARGRYSEALAACGVGDYRRDQTQVMTRLPTSEEAMKLKQAPGQPVLVTEAVDVDAHQKPVKFGIAAFAGQRVQLKLET
ncbi:MAG: phosphonate metabolism transcriptional regulator PhnF [Geminicoccaceae bacterium]